MKVTRHNLFQIKWCPGPSTINSEPNSSFIPIIKILGKYKDSEYSNCTSSWKTDSTPTVVQVTPSRKIVYLVSSLFTIVLAIQWLFPPPHSLHEGLHCRSLAVRVIGKEIRLQLRRTQSLQHLWTLEKNKLTPHRWSTCFCSNLAILKPSDSEVSWPPPLSFLLIRAL